MSVLFDDEMRGSLIRGVNLISKAVGVTFGPNGRNVIIQRGNGVHITKDGATVALHVNDSDPVVQMAIEVIKDIATKTAKDVGDGTTTATILAAAIVNTLKNSVDNPIVIQRALQKDCELIIKYLTDAKKEVIDFEDIKKVATLSANNDPKLGELIASAYKTVGQYGIVNIDESTDVVDSYKVTEGMQIESGYISPFFINTEKNTCELENVLVFISDEKLTQSKQIQEIAGRAIKENKTLLVIAPEIDTTISRILLLNKGRSLESCIIKSPNNGYYRDIMLGDLKHVLGTTMTCEKVIVTKDDTTFIGTQADINNDAIIEGVNKLIRGGALSEFELVFHKRRLANFLGGVCTILVGGYSTVEIKEKKDRVEDAISATKAALIGGVLPGGGRALEYCAEKLKKELKYLGEVLLEPIRILRANAAVDPMSLSDDIWRGQDLLNNKEVDMFEAGIIDPYLVTKTALENAVSAASLILTSGCSIIKIEE